MPSRSSCSATVCGCACSKATRRAVGKTLRLNGRPHTIVGVMPPRFGWFTSDGFWLPLAPTRTDVPWVLPIVRLAPGVTAAAAEEQVQALNRRFAEERPDSFPKQGFTTRLRNYLDVTVASGEMRTSLQLLLGAVGFLLLIACANVANLQLARGVSRAREIAVRMSIGADRRRLLRQLLTESVLLSVIGGALGVLFAFGAIRAIVALMPEFYVPNESRVAINLPVLGFSLAVSVLTGIIAGLVPALQASKTDTSQVLTAGRSTGAGGHGARTRSALVIVEVALSVVLLVCASLTVRTFLALQALDSGLQVDRVLLMNVPMAQERYETRDQRNAFARQLQERIRSLPGVEAVTFGFPGSGRPMPFTIAGQNQDGSRRIGAAFAGAEHLRTYGIPLRRGRMFDAIEVERGDRVAVINEAAAALWPAGQDPVGRQLRLRLLEQPPPGMLIDRSRGADVTIVGVIANTRNAGLRVEPAPVVILPYSIAGMPQLLLAVRAATGDPTQLLNPVRAEVKAIDAEQPLGRPITLSEVFGAGGGAAALHDGHVRHLRRSRPGAGGDRHLQRALVPRHPPHPRARRPHGAGRRRAAACSGSCSAWGRSWCSPGSVSASSPASARRVCCAISCSACSPPIRSPTSRSSRFSAPSRSSPATCRRAAPPASIRWWRCGRTEARIPSRLRSEWARRAVFQAAPSL